MSLLKTVAKQLRLQYYKGNRFQCNFCKVGLREFLRVGSQEPVIFETKMAGAGYRPTQCPKCGSRDRQRLLLLYLQEYTNLFKDDSEKSLLHVSPNFLIRKELEKLSSLNYIKVDKFMPGYSYPSDTVNMDITDIQYEEDIFDIILCNHVLEHIPNDKLAISELYRVLKPGGFSILQVPISTVNRVTQEDLSVNSDELRKKYYGQFDHVRLYGLDYKNKLIDAGFSVHIINLNSDPMFIKYGLNPIENLYVCKKS